MEDGQQQLIDTLKLVPLDFWWAIFGVTVFGSDQSREKQIWMVPRDLPSNVLGEIEQEHYMKMTTDDPWDALWHLWAKTAILIKHKIRANPAHLTKEIVKAAVRVEALTSQRLEVIMGVRPSVHPEVKIEVQDL